VHSQADEACKRRPREKFVGFSKEQEKMMRSKKKRPGFSEPEKWFEVYKILFPDDAESDFPTPCKSWAVLGSILEIFML
jgi:hypothetical protein